MGRPQTPETRAKIAAALKGRPGRKWTDAQRVFNREVRIAPETREKIRQHALARSHLATLTAEQRAEYDYLRRNKNILAADAMRMIVGAH
jgi:hypothetical protein